MKTNGEILVTVAVVINNDRDIIKEFIRDTTHTLSKTYRYYEILLVDDGSSDDTGELVKVIQKTVPNLRLIRLPRRYGTEIALLCALDNSIGDYVIVMDINHDPPTLIPTMVEGAISGYDVVIAECVTKDKMSFVRRKISRLLEDMVYRILGYRFELDASYYRLLSRVVVNSITRIRNKKRYFKYFTALMGYKQTILQYERICRMQERRRKTSLRGRALAVVDIIISNSAVPLRIVSLIGVVASLLNLFYMGVIFISAIVKEDIIGKGWISSSVMTTSMFLMLFVILSVISEYLARILDESQDRPLYFVEYESDSTVSSYKGDLSKEGLNVV